MEHDFGFPYEILGDTAFKEHHYASVIRDAAGIIISKFVWDSTKEGWDYWEGVYEGLNRIAAQGY